jgi:hypothetical protein
MADNIGAKDDRSNSKFNQGVPVIKCPLLGTPDSSDDMDDNGVSPDQETVEHWNTDRLSVDRTLVEIPGLDKLVEEFSDVFTYLSAR